MKRLTSVAIIVVLTCSFVCAESLEEAVAKHAIEVEKAKEPVVAGFAELILQANKNGDTSRSNRILELSERFSNSGSMYFPGGKTEIPLLYKKYGGAIKTAGDELQAAYVSEMKTATETKDFDRLHALTTQLESHRLPGKLVSFQTTQANIYLNHWGLLFRAGQVPNDEEKFNATFELRPGLDNAEFTSIHSVNHPKSFVDHFGFRIRLTESQSDKSWKKHATFIRITGLSDPKDGVSFEATTHPGRFIRIRPNGEAWLDPFENNISYKRSATFYIKPGLYKLW